MKRKTLLLTSREIRSLLTVESCLKIVEAAFRAQGMNRVVLPAKLYLTLPKKVGDFRAMPAFIQKPAACGVRLPFVMVHARASFTPAV